MSETLAPAMLQFCRTRPLEPIRYRRGWIIVAAGNPPAYNKSVREFDIVTLDRVRKISIQADTDVWLEYAGGKGHTWRNFVLSSLKKGNYIWWKIQ